jgi:peptidoglycan/LPS O-acetylase OafA/YrhL
MEGRSAMPDISTRGERFPFIDTLRGAAALLVVGVHLCSPAWAPPALAAVLGVLFVHDDRRIQAFFVISGFVLALALYPRPGASAARRPFLSRRLLRFCPPYWAALAVQVLALLAARAYWADGRHPDLGLRQLVAHLFFLQHFLGYPPLQPAFWTQCLFLQLYLFFPVAVGLAGWYAARRGRPGRILALPLAVVFIPLAVASLAVHDDRPYGFPVTLLPNWHMVFAGALTAWALTGVVAHRLVYGIAAGWVGWLAAVRWDAASAAALGTAGLIYVVGRLGRLHDLRLPGLAWLGRISYSLYLVHDIVGDRVMGLSRRLGASQAWHMWLWFAAAVLASVAAAYVLYVGVEEPCRRLSQRLARREAPAPVGELALSGVDGR